MNKSELRKKYQEKIDKLSIERKIEASQKACSYLLTRTSKLSTIASFAPFQNEIDLWPFNEQMIKEGRLALPKVSGKDLIFYKIENIKNLTLSKWGILEPSIKLTRSLSIDCIDLVIVPALAFDIHHQRLGKGKGFYDYFIANHQPKSTLGIGYQEQFHSGFLPSDLQDQKVKEYILF